MQLKKIGLLSALLVLGLQTQVFAETPQEESSLVESQTQTSVLESQDQTSEPKDESSQEEIHESPKATESTSQSTTTIQLDEIDLRPQPKDIYVIDNKTNSLEYRNKKIVVTDQKGNLVTGIAFIALKSHPFYDPNTYYYVVNGEFVESFSGLTKPNQAGKTHYIEKGKLVKKTGIVTIGNDRYYVEDGQVKSDLNGFHLIDKTGYVFESGKVNQTVTNLIKYQDIWYYVEKGQVRKDILTLAQVDGKGVWYYVKNGQIDWTYTGLVKYYDVWYYVEKGQVNFQYTGLVLYYDVWYYVQKGQINWGISNLVKHEGIWYYIENSQITWGKQTLARVDGKGVWYYVSNSQIDWTYTGLTLFDGNWYYIIKGQLDTNFTDLVLHADKWHYVKKGVVDFHFTGLVRYSGKLFYVKQGLVDWTYNGSATFNGQTYQVRNGQVPGSHYGAIPYYSQRDSRWANQVFGFSNMAISGCAPTVMAMAFSSIKNQTILPTQVANYLYQNKYLNHRVPGTLATGIAAGVQHYGLKYKVLYSSAEVKTALQEGKYVFVAVGSPTPYALSGTHLMLLNGYSANGTSFVRDPYNSANNGWVSVDYLWSIQSKDPDDRSLGSPFIAVFD